MVVVVNSVNTPVSPRIINGADIDDEIVPYLHHKLSKNKWTSKKIAKEFRNRHSKQNNNKYKNNYYKSQKSYKGASTSSIQLNKNKSHRRRETNNTYIKSQRFDMLDDYQCDLESILTENIDGIYGNDDMVLDKNLLVFDSPKRRWRTTKTNKKKNKESIPSIQTPAIIPDSPESTSSYQSDSYGTGSIKSFSLKSITPTNPSTIISSPPVHFNSKHDKYVNISGGPAKQPNTISSNTKNSKSNKLPIKYNITYTKSIITNTTATKKKNIINYDSDDSSVSSSISSSSKDFVTAAFNNKHYGSDSSSDDDSDDDDYIPPSVKASKETIDVSNVDIDGFDIKEELKLIGLVNKAGDEIKETKEDKDKIEEKYVEEIENIEELSNYAPIEGLASRCSFKEYNKDDETTKMDPKTLKRVFNEIRIDLPKNLTLQWNGSMFVRFDEENPRFLQALLTGLEGTPYENGMFLFDIYLHKDYPNSPLNIKHVTKGGSTVYGSHTPGGFSPNLHRDSGKVCLSLLGTWGTNQWDSKTSNIYQVLSSILWMILGAQWAYYMEPSHGGWEGTCNMNESDPSKHTKEVVKYQYEVIEKCMKYAMLETLKTPYQGFEDVIKIHFKLKKKEILGNILNKWIKYAPDVPKKKALIALYNSLKEEFNKL